MSSSIKNKLTYTARLTTALPTYPMNQSWDTMRDLVSWLVPACNAQPDDPVALLFRTITDLDGNLRLASLRGKAISYAPHWRPRRAGGSDWHLELRTLVSTPEHEAAIRYFHTWPAFSQILRTHIDLSRQNEWAEVDILACQDGLILAKGDRYNWHDHQQDNLDKNGHTLVRALTPYDMTGHGRLASLSSRENLAALASYHTATRSTPLIHWITRP